jgi:hypothetical protein
VRFGLATEICPAQLLARFHELSSKEISMDRKYIITNALLWATAIIASVVVGAPAVLSGVLLPVLATGSLLALQRKPDNAACAHE